MTERKTMIERAREDLVAAIERLRTEEGWQAWIHAKARMYTYSPNNQLLIWTQNPEATIVRGKGQWRDDFNRQLLPGAKPLWILAPRSKKLDEIDPETGEKKVRRWFKGVRVYDVADTAQIPGEQEIPLEPPRESIAGESHRMWINAFWKLAHELQYRVEGRDLTGTNAGGWCDSDARLIVWDTSLSANEQVRVLAHELAHAAGIRYSDEGGRRRAEACADAAAFIACHAIGLDVSGESVPYIAGWADDAEEIIESDIKRLDTIAHWLAGARDKDRRPLAHQLNPGNATGGQIAA